MLTKESITEKYNRFMKLKYVTKHINACMSHNFASQENGLFQLRHH